MNILVPLLLTDHALIFVIHYPAGQVKKTVIVPKGCDRVIQQPKVNIFNPEVQKQLKWDDGPQVSAGSPSTGLKSDGYVEGTADGQSGGGIPPPNVAAPAAPTTGQLTGISGPTASVQETLAAVRHAYCVVLS